MMRISRYRDLTILHDDEKSFVIACDSSGGIGPKKLDVVKTDGYTLGRFLARVVLMEIISVGAKPITIIDTLAVEMNPTGQEIISGIRAEAEQLGLDTNNLLNGSTEENMPVQQTGVGITAIGEVSNLECESSPGDQVICIGVPKVGNEVSLEDPEICNLPVVQELREIVGVHEIVPIGSKGINYELNELLKRNQMSLIKFQTGLDLHKSAGPVTCVIATVKLECIETIKKIVTQPISILGRLIDKT
ncbi:MAG: AIR synthase related protein [Anaerobacillus sp.]|uniref:AIR synthase related protein n=1 Tax=Anaerobacillus sp. TaxID=1872506 RepID=UPI0039198DB5